MSRAAKPTVEYRWQAYNNDGVVMKQGPIRDSLEKVEKYADEIQAGIDGMGGPDADGLYPSGWTPAPYWFGLHIRIVTRTISPWTVHSDSVFTLGELSEPAMQSQASEAKV